MSGVGSGRGCEVTGVELGRVCEMTRVGMGRMCGVTGTVLRKGMSGVGGFNTGVTSVGGSDVRETRDLMSAR